MEVCLIDGLGSEALIGNQSPAQGVRPERLPRRASRGHGVRHGGESGGCASVQVCSKRHTEEAQPAVGGSAHQAVLAQGMGLVDVSIEVRRDGACEMLQNSLGSRLCRAAGAMQCLEGGTDNRAELSGLKDRGLVVISKGDGGRRRAARGKGEGGELAGVLEAGEVASENLARDVI